MRRAAERARIHGDIRRIFKEHLGSRCALLALAEAERSPAPEQNNARHEAVIFIICAYFFISFTDAVEPERIGAAIDDMVGSERTHKLICGIRGADKAL